MALPYNNIIVYSVLFILQEQNSSRRHWNTPFDNKTVSSYLKHSLSLLLVGFFLDPFLRGCEVCPLYCSTQDSWSKNLVLTLAGPVISKWSHQDHFQNVSEIIFILPGMVNSVLSLFLFFFFTLNTCIPVLPCTLITHVPACKLSFRLQQLEISLVLMS